MKIYSDFLIDSKVNGTLYTNDFKCKNMLNPYTFIRGNISDNGSYQSNTVNYLSDYIEVKPNTQYIASANVAQSFFQISEWTNNKIFIKRTALQNTATNTITTTATTKYVRISYNKDNITAMTQEILLGFEPQLETGDKATSYTPYKAFENIDIPISNILYNNTTTLDTFFNSLLKCTLKYTTDGADSVSDSTTKIYQLERNGFYLFIDSHPYNNSVGIINGFNGNVKNIIETSGHLVFTYNSSNYQMTVRTINGARFKLYKIEGQVNV